MHQRWLNASLGRKGLAVVILPTVALLVSFIGFLSVAITSRNALAGVQTSLNAQSSLQSVLTLTIDAETGIRGFIISNSPSYLAPYDGAKKELTATFAGLANQLAGDKNSLSLLKRLHMADNSICFCCQTFLPIAAIMYHLLKMPASLLRRSIRPIPCVGW